MEDFEKWAKENNLDITRNRRGYGYFFLATERFWECWQAAQSETDKFVECEFSACHNEAEFEG